MIPVVLIHKGTSDRYLLDTVIQQAQLFGNDIIHIGDGHLHQYSGLATEFAKHYEHLSGNHVEFERFCFERWFILYEWMATENHDIAFYQDSDVLLFCNVREAWPQWGEDYAFTLSKGTSPATSYFTLRGLRAFLDFVNNVYVNRNANFTELTRIYIDMMAQKLPGGICDMTLFKFFREQIAHLRVGEMSEVKNFQVFDHNINSSDGFEMRNGIKKIDMMAAPLENTLPFGVYGEGLQSQTVRFLALHFQGQAKRLMREYIK